MRMTGLNVIIYHDPLLLTNVEKQENGWYWCKIRAKITFLMIFENLQDLRLLF